MAIAGDPVDITGFVYVPDGSDEVVAVAEGGAASGVVVMPEDGEASGLVLMPEGRGTTAVAALPLGRTVRRDIGSRAVKRAMDVFGALIAMTLCIPAFLVIALAVACTSPGQVVYVHRRVGRDGRPFPLVKFRTMHRDADALLVEHLARDEELARQWEQNRKLNPDPRVTTVGRMLRRFSLDELPQLANVLVGHMSFVGPRPVMEDELVYYGARRDDILALRPGLTGLWAVSGRSDIGYEERAEFEYRYAHTWGFRRDLSILVRTIPAVFRGSGAY
jgi:exopolysaccharide production protein ExoY